MRPPQRFKVNGYYVMQVSDGWEVADDDQRLAGPFNTQEEAEEAARDQPRKGW